MTAKERAKKVWKRIVGAGETGDDMAVEWIAQEINQAVNRAILDAGFRKEEEK